MMIPNITANAKSESKGGESSSVSGFQSGDFSVGQGGSSNPADFMGLIKTYWPLLLIGAGVVWYLKNKKRS